MRKLLCPVCCRWMKSPIELRHYDFSKSALNQDFLGFKKIRSIHTPLSLAEVRDFLQLLKLRLLFFESLLSEENPICLDGVVDLENTEGDLLLEGDIIL